MRAAIPARSGDERLGRHRRRGDAGPDGRGGSWCRSDEPMATDCGACGTRCRRRLVVGRRPSRSPRVLAGASDVRSHRRSAPGSRCDRHVARRDRRRDPWRARGSGGPDRAGRRSPASVPTSAWECAGAATPRASYQGWADGGRRPAAVPVGDAGRPRARGTSGSSTGREAAPSGCASAEWAAGDRVLVSGAARSTRRRVGACASRRSTWSASSTMDVGGRGRRRRPARSRIESRPRRARARIAGTARPPTPPCSVGSCSATTPSSRRTMIDRFRASGLSHLTAVSGQNVAFLLAAAGPVAAAPAAGGCAGRSRWR